MEKKKQVIRGQLRHRVETRISAARFKELTELLKSSENSNMSELLRDILDNREIKVNHHDNTFDQVILNLTLLRQELNKVGVNINQITHYFNGSKDTERRLFHAMEVAGRLEKVQELIASVMSEITKAGVLWSQR